MVICVELTNVTVLGAALNAPVRPLTKFVPMMVSEKAGPPAVALGGAKEVIVGTGLLTVNVWAAVVPPPGAVFVTVTLTGPAVFSWAAGMVIVSVFPPLETTPPLSALVPKFTTEPVMKPVPVSVRFTDWPRVPLVGAMEVSVGAGLLTVKVCAAVVPPPGVGLVTVTLTGPAVFT